MPIGMRAILWPTLVIAGVLCKPGFAVDLTGTWIISTQLTTGQRSHPTFKLVQEGDTLSGAYEGILGKSQITGKVNGTSVTWEYETKIGLTKVKAVYTGAIKSSTEMTGEMKFNEGKLASGTWTGQKK